MSARSKKCPDCGAKFRAETSLDLYCEDCTNAFSDRVEERTDWEHVSPETADREGR